MLTITFFIASSRFLFTTITTLATTATAPSQKSDAYLGWTPMRSDITATVHNTPTATNSPSGFPLLWQIKLLHLNWVVPFSCSCCPDTLIQSHNVRSVSWISTRNRCGAWRAPIGKCECLVKTVKKCFVTINESSSVSGLSRGSYLYENEKSKRLFLNLSAVSDRFINHSCSYRHIEVRNHLPSGVSNAFQETDAAYNNSHHLLFRIQLPQKTSAGYYEKIL